MATRNVCHQLNRVHISANNQLRLGTAVCGPHSCQHCGAAVDTLGRHALSCKRSEGRYQWHAAIKGIVQQVMSAHIPSRLEPTGLMKLDRKRPDGVTLAPWKSGCLLVWDATCLDTLAALYRVHVTSVPGKVERKNRKYQGLPPGHLFAPITTIETLGTIGPRITSLS